MLAENVGYWPCTMYYSLVAHRPSPGLTPTSNTQGQPRMSSKCRSIATLILTRRGWSVHYYLITREPELTYRLYGQSQDMRIYIHDVLIACMDRPLPFHELQSAHPFSFTGTGTDAGAHSSWSADPFLAFATSTIFTTSARGLEHGAAYDRLSDYGLGR
jgi:hypothetical protein